MTTSTHKNKGRESEHESPRSDMFGYWIGLVMPDARNALQSAPKSFLANRAWVTGKTVDGPEDAPRERQNVACFVIAPDLAQAFNYLRTIWDLTPDDVELLFAWEMPCNWLPGPGLKYGENQTPPSLANLGTDLGARAPELFVNATR